MKNAETYRRLFAGIIDLLIWVVVIACFSILSELYYSWSTLILNILIVGLFLPSYMVISSCSNYGMSLGKRIMSIRIIDKTTNQKLGVKQALKREWLLVGVGILYITQQSWTITVGFDHFNAIINENWREARGFMAPSTLGGFVSKIVWWTPFIWFGLEVISTVSNPERESIQDRSSSSLTIIKEKNVA